jgi:hypothetical protein
MLRIRTKIWSPSTSGAGQGLTNKSILASRAAPIKSFKQLVKTTAAISFNNPEHVLFFRGQSTQYWKTSAEERVASFYPSIYRSKGSRLTDEELKERFRKLDDRSERLLENFKDEHIVGHEKLANFPELVWAILQHYRVCDTPLLDLTHSLRVAASFAFLESNDSNFVFVFGFPYPNGSITYSVDSELLNIRLLSICPPEAQWPYFQEAFLVGSFPSRRTHKHPNLDVGVRLIAKFKLLGEGFWDKDFQPIPERALFPARDRVDQICSRLRDL